MKIALIGYGKMGQAVKRIGEERGHEFPVVVDHKEKNATHQHLEAGALKDVDMVVDFSLGESVLKHIEICGEAGKNLIVGTTGWYEKLEEVKKLVEKSKIGFLWSSNFSIGVNLYFKIIEDAAKLMNDFDEYDVWGYEIHHANKADSPSGTAKTLEKILLENIERKKKVVEEKLDRKREPNEIHFASVRGGVANFNHTVGFDAPADTITISHVARNRDGYALGAVKAAEWLKGKKGYFEMKDFLNF